MKKYLLSNLIEAVDFTLLYMVNDCFWQFLLSFLFGNKTLRVNNLNTRTAINAKISVLLFVLKGSFICYYAICMTVPLISLQNSDVMSPKKCVFPLKQQLGRLNSCYSSRSEAVIKHIQN